MSNVLIIPARGGSKRIPRKNIREFCGKPIIAYSIEAGLNSGLFDEVMVSTDDVEIAGIAEQYGATVPFMRSAETASDFASSEDAIREAVLKYDELGKKYDIVAVVYPTAPFTTSEKIRKMYDSLQDNEKCDMVTSMVRFSFPPQRGWYIREGKGQPISPEMQYMRSQDLEVIYHDAGQMYLFRRTGLFKERNDRYVIPFVLPETEVQDIDDLEDWKIAEIKYQLMINK